MNRPLSEFIRQGYVVTFSRADLDEEEAQEMGASMMFSCTIRTTYHQPPGAYCGGSFRDSREALAEAMASLRAGDNVLGEGD